MSGDRILAVATVDSSVRFASRFISRALASGVDHLVVFVEEPRTDLEDALRDAPSVTLVRTDRAYWQGEGPDRSRDRERTNANVALAALAEVSAAGWVFQIDEDQALCFDREELLRLAPVAARFPVLEAAASRRWRSAEPQTFKRDPSPADLRALAALGVIERPERGSYYRGPHAGRVGVRPGHGVRFAGVEAYAGDERLAPAEPPGMYVLNLGAWSLEDFVDRWRSFDPARSRGGMHRGEHLGTAVHTLLRHPALGEEDRSRLLAELFDRLLADDIDTLADFGLLGGRPDALPVPPRPLPAADLRGLEEALADLFSMAKEPFGDTSEASSEAEEDEADETGAAWDAGDNDDEPEVDE